MPIELPCWSDPQFVRRLVCIVACLGTAVSSLEWFVPAGKLGPSGLLSAGCDATTRAVRLWRQAGLRLTLVLRLGCAIAFPLSVFLTPHVPEATFAVITAGVLSLPLRFRDPVGVFSGMDGAEHLLTSTMLVLGATYLFESRLVLEAALIFIAFQTLIEYGIAGCTKLRDWSGWASGTNLLRVFASSNYGHPGIAALLRTRPALGGFLSISLIALELSAPIAVVIPAPVAELLLLALFSFHLATAVAMGLNTFVWAFPATFPAILHCRDLLIGC